MITRNHPAVLIAALALSATFVSAADVAPTAAAPFGDRMVLQREMAVPVWGSAAPGAAVAVTFAGQTKSATADANGRWQVKLDPLPASAENRPLTLTSGSARTVIQDVLVGEVWVCSGQSNMEWGIFDTLAGKDAEQANDPSLRLRHVDKKVAPIAVETFTGSQWLACNAENLHKSGTHVGFSATAYCFGKELRAKLNVPVGLIQSAWGGTLIEPWTPPCGFEAVPALAGTASFLRKADADYRNNLTANLDAFAAFEKSARAALANNSPLPPPPPPITHPVNNEGQPTALYNAMIHPLIPYGIRGAIWYQGESNRGQGMLYFDKMKALVGGWRKLWNQGDFPFYFVQLAPFNYGNSPEALAEIWEAQSEAATRIPNTGMAAISDVGNTKDIHPRDKNTVGQRLARLALSRTYGHKFTDDCGPLFKSSTVRDGTIRVEFDYANSGLVTRDGKPPSHFEIAGDDGKFVPAEAVIDGKAVVVRSPQVPAPAQVRFAWDHCAEPNLSNKDGLPAIAFRAPRPINYALNAPYTCSNPNRYNWGASGQLTDGSWEANQEHCFASNDEDTFPKEIVVDLQEPRALREVKFGVPPFGSTKTVIVSASADGKTYQELGRHEFPQSQPGVASVKANQTKARYIKLVYPDHHEAKVQYPNTFVFTTELEAR